MKNQITLEQALEKVSSLNLTKITKGKHMWELFKAFRCQASHLIHYFHLIQVKNQYHLSDEKFVKCKENFGPYLHPTKITTVQRNTEYTFYLLQASENIILLTDLIKLKQECHENLDEATIFSIIKLVSNLSFLKGFQQLSLTVESFCIKEGKCLLFIPQQIYFKKHQTAHKIQIFQSLRTKLLKIIERLIENDQKAVRQKSEVFSTIEKSCYSQRLYFLLQKITSLTDLSANDLKFLISEYEKQPSKHILSTVVAQSQIFEAAANRQSNAHCLRQNLTEHLLPIQIVKDEIKEQKEKSKSFRKKLLIIVLIIFLLLGGTVGMIIWRIRSKKVCAVGEYSGGKSKCLSCYSECLRCVNQKKDSCISCRGENYFLVTKNENQTVGECNAECKGRIYNKTYCVISQKSDIGKG